MIARLIVLSCLSLVLWASSSVVSSTPLSSTKEDDLELNKHAKLWNDLGFEVNRDVPLENLLIRQEQEKEKNVDNIPYKNTWNKKEKTEEQVVTDSPTTTPSPLPVHPIILVPGIAGSKIEAKLNKTSTPHPYICSKVTIISLSDKRINNESHLKVADWYTLWVSPHAALPMLMDCFKDNFQRIFNHETGRTDNAPGVETRIPGFGDTHGWNTSLIFSWNWVCIFSQNLFPSFKVRTHLNTFLTTRKDSCHKHNKRTDRYKWKGESLGASFVSVSGLQRRLIERIWFPCLVSHGKTVVEVQRTA